MNYYYTNLTIELEDRIIELPIRVNYLFSRNFDQTASIQIKSIDAFYDASDFTQAELDIINEQLDLAEKSELIEDEILSDETYDYNYIEEKM